MCIRDRFREFAPRRLAGLGEVHPVECHEVLDEVPALVAVPAPPGSAILLCRPDMKAVIPAAGGARAVIFASLRGGDFLVHVTALRWPFQEVHRLHASLRTIKVIQDDCRMIVLALVLQLSL
jgi:hypothetical protein